VRNDSVAGSFEAPLQRLHHGEPTERRPLRRRDEPPRGARFSTAAGPARNSPSKYAVTMLVWYEHYSNVNDAIAREKQLKKWERPLETWADRELQSGMAGSLRDAEHVTIGVATDISETRAHSGAGRGSSLDPRVRGGWHQHIVVPAHAGIQSAATDTSKPRPQRRSRQLAGPPRSAAGV